MKGFPLDRLIYGGSFDPPHRGHFSMLRYVLENNLTRLVDLVPAQVSPFKEDAPPLPPEIRLEMLRLGLEGFLSAEEQNRVRVTDAELRRAPPSYSRDTCRVLREEFPGARIGLLLGSDSVRELDRWMTPEEILREHPILVFLRLGEDEASVRRSVRELEERYARESPRFFYFSQVQVDCSSTQLRRIFAREEEEARGPYPRNCLPPALLEYILSSRLYRSLS